MKKKKESVNVWNKQRRYINDSAAKQEVSHKYSPTSVPSENYEGGEREKKSNERIEDVKMMTPLTLLAFFVFLQLSVQAELAQS